MTELALGTVQFGLNYGVTNSAGEIPDSEMVSMIDVAHQSGIRLFDTAADYGNSQVRLGELVSPESKIQYVTKFSLPTDGALPTSTNIYLSSMQQLKIDKLHGVLFHKMSDLTDQRVASAVNILRDGRANNLIARAGVSIYSLVDLHQALDVFPDLDIVQLPANILDLKLLESTDIQNLIRQGVEVHVRSVFLQGLLLTSPEDLPEYFAPLVPALKILRETAAEQNRTVLELVLGKLKNHPYIGAVLVGATTTSELNQICAAWQNAETIEDFELPFVSKDLLDPRNWPQIRMSS